MDPPVLPCARRGFSGRIDGWDQSLLELRAALEMGAVDGVAGNQWGALELARQADVVVLAVPVLAIKDWMQQLASVTGPRPAHHRCRQHQARDLRACSEPLQGRRQGRLSRRTSYGWQRIRWSSAGRGQSISRCDVALYPRVGSALPMEKEWRSWVNFFGTRTLDMDPKRHDEMCAWVSHLPQMLSTALAALLEDRFGDAPEIAAIGGRALRETTRLGASPYSMWRDVALTNTDPIAETLLALEQRLGHVRENLRTPGLREEFELANQFRVRR